MRVTERRASARTGRGAAVVAWPDGPPHAAACAHGEHGAAVSNRGGRADRGVSREAVTDCTGSRGSAGGGGVRAGVGAVLRAGGADVGCWEEDKGEEVTERVETFRKSGLIWCGRE